MAEPLRSNGEQENKPDADVISDPGAADSDDVDTQQAVERFIELHGAGKATDPMTFAEGYRQELRSAILSQCREFLMFDGLLGKQEWQEPAAKPEDGRAFGDFLIQEELGRGGMGVVYLAKQKSLDRRVALKVMASGLTLSKRHVERFRREAMATAQLRHPAIVPVHSFVEVDGAFALAMDYVAGRNLADMLDDLRLANREGEGVAVGTLGIATEKGYVAECAMLVAQVASALATAHHNQVVHRDLKPRNLMIDERRQVRLLDFGLAKSLDATRESISMSGEITGTAHYMSPEQTLAKRVEVDHRADIWSLGVILYELLTLRRPFDGKNLQQIVYEICFKEPTPLQRHNQKVPRDLVTICQKALEKDPGKRYQTAADFEADLQRFLRWEPVHAKPASPWTRAAKFVRRHRTETAIALTLLIATTAVLGFVWARSTMDANSANSLLQRAEARASTGDYQQAITLTNQALTLRNDAVTRERLGRYHAENKRIENEAYLKVAQSKQLLEHDREGAMLLALRAEQQLSNALTRSAVLDALGSGWAKRTLSLPDNERVLRASWSPSGNRVVVGGARGTLCIFDREADGAQPIELLGHEASLPIAGAAFASEDRLVSLSPDQTLRLWNARAGAQPRTLQLGNPAAALRTSQDGGRALFFSYKSLREVYAQIWDTQTGTRLGEPVLHDSYIFATELSGDGSIAATCCGAHSVVRLWNATTGETIANIDEHGGPEPVRVLAFSPDSTLFATGTRHGAVRIYNAQNGALLGEVRHTNAVNCIAFDPSNTRMLTGSLDLTAQLWEFDRSGSGDDQAITIRPASIFTGHRGPVEHVGFDSEGELALTATGKPGATIQIFDVEPGQRVGNQSIHRYEVGAAIESARFAPNSRHVLAVANRRALVLDFRSARGIVSLKQTGKVPAVSFTQDGNDLVTAGDDERVRRWHARDGRQIWATKRLGSPIRTLDVAPNDERVAYSDVDGVVHVLSMHDGAGQFKLQGHGESVPVVRFLQDGTRLLTAGASAGDPTQGTVLLWNLAQRSTTAKLTLPHPVVSADVSADGSLLATVEADQHHARLWSLPDLKDRGAIAQHEGPVHHAQFAPGGTNLLTASADRTVRIHDLTDQLLTQFSVESPVVCATFSPDSSTVLTCSIEANGTAQLWRVADGTELLHFEGHRGTLMWGTFSSNGDWVATSAKDGSTCIWPTDPVGVAARLPLRSEAKAALDHSTSSKSDRSHSTGSHSSKPR